nr:reverse transcriptase domain-containing protein [Tanacetum cinerariifolium]
MNELNELRNQAYENSLIFKEKTKKIHDFKIKNPIFNVGDRVLLFNSRLKIFSGKLKTRLTGPFTVAQVFPYGTVELSQTDRPNFKSDGFPLVAAISSWIEEKTIPLCDIISQLPPSIIIITSPLVLSIEDPKDSLIMGNENLSTIPEKESDEVIKSSVEYFVPIPSESEDTSGSDITPLFDSNEDECFDPGGDVDEINAFDNPLSFKDGYYDSEGDVLYLESLLSDETTPNLPPEVFLDRDPRSLSDINDLQIMVKVFNLEIPYGESKVHIEVLSVLWGNRLPILDGSLPLSR